MQGGVLPTMEWAHTLQSLSAGQVLIPQAHALHNGVQLQAWIIFRAKQGSMCALPEGQISTVAWAPHVPTVPDRQIFVSTACCVQRQRRWRGALCRRKVHCWHHLCALPAEYVSAAAEPQDVLPLPARQVRQQPSRVLQGEHTCVSAWEVPICRFSVHRVCQGALQPAQR